MPDTHHLSKAPIAECLIHFQANASQHWDAKTVRERLQPAWPEHTSVQEMQPVKFEVKHEPGKPPEQKISFRRLRDSSFEERTSKRFITLEGMD